MPKKSILLRMLTFHPLISHDQFHFSTCLAKAWRPNRHCSIFCILLRFQSIRLSLPSLDILLLASWIETFNTKFSFETSQFCPRPVARSIHLSPAFLNRSVQPRTAAGIPPNRPSQTARYFSRLGLKLSQEGVFIRTASIQAACKITW